MNLLAQSYACLLRSQSLWDSLPRKHYSIVALVTEICIDKTAVILNKKYLSLSHTHRHAQVLAGAMLQEAFRNQTHGEILLLS